MTKPSILSFDAIRIRAYDVDDECLMIDLVDAQVQPDIEELTPNMEDNEDADSKKSEAPNLGKLEYSIDYDFQKQEVRLISQGNDQPCVTCFSFHLVKNRSDSSSRTACNGYERYLGSVRESLRSTRQEEEVRDQSVPENLESNLQRSVRLQGKCSRSIDELTNDSSSD